MTPPVSCCTHCLFTTMPGEVPPAVATITPAVEANAGRTRAAAGVLPSVPAGAPAPPAAAAFWLCALMFSQVRGPAWAGGLPGGLRPAAAAGEAGAAARGAAGLVCCCCCCHTGCVGRASGLCCCCCNSGRQLLLCPEANPKSPAQSSASASCCCCCRPAEGGVATGNPTMILRGTSGTSLWCGAASGACGAGLAASAVAALLVGGGAT